MAMVGIGPMPGRTPINVPSTQPISAKPMFAHVPAAPNPVMRLPMTSTSEAPEPLRTPEPVRTIRQRLAERIDEDQHRRGRQADAEQDGFGQIELAACQARGYHDHNGGHGEADARHLDAEDGEAV